VLATTMAGVMLLAIGLLRGGDYIKFIPLPVTVGFTAGIAVIIFSTQVKELLGLALPQEPVAFVPKLVAIGGAIATVNPATVAISVLSIATILVVRRLRPTWPSFLIAVLVAAALVPGLNLDVATVGSRFGDIPSGLPSPALPTFSLEKMQAVLPDAMAIALLGAIESLLSAVVADGMTGRRHRSNCELAAQGIGNVASGLFGGIAVTGTIARTATNIRSGARGPFAGMFHSLYLLLFILFAAPLVAYIPLAALGAVLAVVAWNMAEKEEFRSLVRGSRGDALVLLATFLLTVFVDLIAGIGTGVVLGALLLMQRMAEAVEVEGGPAIPRDTADMDEAPYAPAEASHPDVMVYRISGAFFFGATARVTPILERLGPTPKVFVLDFEDVPLIDSTAARSLAVFTDTLRRSGTAVCFAAARPGVRSVLMNAGLREPKVRYIAQAADAVSASG
jgi:sulfate permease, SulP family